MKGVIFSAKGEEPKVVDDLTKPQPADDQVLVKSLWTAINPLDSMMGSMGLLVEKWPVVIGCDAAGIVVSAGSIAESKYKLSPGTYVCGCTRCGITEYASGQEFFLMDAALAVPKPSNISVPESATVGGGGFTACLGIFVGLQIPLPDLSDLPIESGKWVVVLGGASSVGKFAVQIARAVGYKVLASCSPKNNDLMQSFGAESFDYKLDIEIQVKSILHITGGNVYGVFDAVAENDPVMVKKLFTKLEGTKYFTTTNSWSGISDFEGGKTFCIELGLIGRSTAQELNEQIESYIPIIKGLMEEGLVKPSAIKVIGDGKGWEGIIEAFKFQQSGKGGSDKVVCKVGDE